MANTSTCRKCGTANPADSQYCDQCSAPLQGQAATLPPADTKPPTASRAVRRAAAAPVVSSPATLPPLTPAPSATATPAPPSAPAPNEGSETVPLETPTLPLPPVAPTVRVGPTPRPSAAAPVRRSLPPLVLMGSALVVALLGIALGATLTSNGGGTPTLIAATATAGDRTNATTPPAGATLPASATLPSVAGPTRLPTTPPDPQDGAGLLAAGQYAAALTVFSTTLATNPQEPAAMLGKGQALNGLHRYGEAANTLTEALAVRGLTDGPALLARAQANAGNQSWAAVIADTDVLLKAEATDLAALLLRAQAHAGAGDSDAAAADYAAALAAHPQDPRIYVARATVEAQAGKKADAISDLKLATTVAPNDATIWLALGRTYLIYESGVTTDPDPALAAFNQALTINPQLAEAYFARAELYQNYKNASDHALADVNQAISAGPATADMYHLRANLEGDLENSTAQLADLNRAVALNPQLQDPYWWRMDYYYHHNQYDKAVADMSEVISLTDDPAAYGQRSLLYVLQADYAHAGSDAAEVLRQQPDRAAGYYAQTLVAFSQGDYAAALGLINNALDRAQPYEKTNIQAMRGRIYVRLKQTAPAKADLDAVLTSEKTNSIGLLGQAEWAVAQGPADAVDTALNACTDNSGGFGACYLVRAGQEAGRGATDVARTDLAEARKRILFPAEQRTAEALAAQLK